MSRRKSLILFPLPSVVKKNGRPGTIKVIKEKFKPLPRTISLKGRITTIAVENVPPNFPSNIILAGIRSLFFSICSSILNTSRLITRQGGGGGGGEETWTINQRSSSRNLFQCRDPLIVFLAGEKMHRRSFKPPS